MKTKNYIVHYDSLTTSGTVEIKENFEIEFFKKLEKEFKLSIRGIHARYRVTDEMIRMSAFVNNSTSNRINVWIY